MQLLIRALTALLPKSPLRRVAVLYVLTLTLLISAGLAAFINITPIKLFKILFERYPLLCIISPIYIQKFDFIRKI
jgi:hypothetical protein